MSRTLKIEVGTRPRFLAIWVGALVTGIQLLFFFSAAPGEGLFEKYLSGFQWDSVWYADIARRGYVTTLPPVPRGDLSNVTHFPGYPLLIWAAKSLLSPLSRFANDIDIKVFSLAVAQVCAWGFWSYLFLFLLEWGFSLVGILLTVLTVFCHPTAFFMVTAFSEPVFLMCILGFLYWVRRPGLPSYYLALAHGFGITATRISGVLVGFLPFLEWGWVRLRQGSKGTSLELLRAAVLSFTSVMGVGLFFLYCQLKFGMWNLYSIRQGIGWGHKADFLAFFYPSSYSVGIPVWTDYYSFGVFLNLWTLVGILLVSGLLVVAARKQREGWEEGFGLVFAAFSIFYIAICGLYHTHFPGMARYNFPVYALLVLAAANGLKRLNWSFGRFGWVAFYGGGVVLVLALWLQYYFASIFARGGGVL